MELRDYARGLRRHWLAILMMIIVGVGVAFGWAKLQTPLYEAAASGVIKTVAVPTGPQEQSLFGTNDTAAQNKVAAYLDLAGYREVAQNVITDLNLNTTPEQLVNLVTVTNPPGTTVLRIVAQGSSPASARALAEAWIRGMVKTIDKVYGTTGQPGSAAVNITPVGSASLPTSPVFPDLRTALLVGAVIGLGFGVGFALMRTASDRRVRAADEVEKKTDVAVVGTIPLSKQDDSEMRLFDPAAGRQGPGFAVAEAMRTLRTNLQFMDVDNPPRTIVVTSPLPGDGKSTIACNLALTLAENGSNVVLVDGDLRRSKVAQTMGLSSSAGLSDILAGRADIGDVLQRAPQSENLYVLAAGSVPPNPSEVLGSARMKAVLEELAAHSTVIIDAPPLIPVTDGAVLTHQADGALIVVSVGKTTYDLVEKALDTLRKARGRALGIVLNKVPLKGADASPYSYEYRRQYGADPVADEAAAPPIPVRIPSVTAGSRSITPAPAILVGDPALAAPPEQASIPTAQEPVAAVPASKKQAVAASKNAETEAPPVAAVAGSLHLVAPADASDADENIGLSAFDSLLNADSPENATDASGTTARRHRARRG
ncbi:polysaccharide biosynthesis tyrosine autokinase [Microbacterium sp. ASV49]|uniref:Polysaccharide biosynthesis tyrosine autokinase n=1 Tax=Microbacterium candidum TaxID=3041922 RepID=A0ABT7MUY1_9MICO|nr:polysaccharide biosynthesis tyrosine autokinase [Microbacterium sp. ASV49]MDL9978267.1 polysaccharide biosynthesis tyrosine autokinase [Microbacterium sp. ASV49]